MNSDLPTGFDSDLPGFRRVIPKEVFLAKLERNKQRASEARMIKAVNDQFSGNFREFDPLYAVIPDISRDMFCAYQRMLIAAYFFPFLFFGNFVFRFPYEPPVSKSDTPHLRIVRYP